MHAATPFGHDGIGAEAALLLGLVVDVRRSGSTAAPRAPARCPPCSARAGCGRPRAATSSIVSERSGAPCTEMTPSAASRSSGADLEHARGDRQHLVADVQRRELRRRAADDDAAGAVVAEAARAGLGVALDDPDPVELQPSASATICAMPVSLPLPGEVTPVSTVTSPVGLTRTSVAVVAVEQQRAGHRAALGGQLLPDAEADVAALAPRLLLERRRSPRSRPCRARCAGPRGSSPLSSIAPGDLRERELVGRDEVPNRTSARSSPVSLAMWSMIRSIRNDAASLP